jgi:TPR repeat protein
MSSNVFDFPSAEPKNAKELTELGKKILNDPQGAPDYAKALECFTKAVELGDGSAHVQIAEIWSNGLGVEPNEDKWEAHILLAIESGNTNAKFIYGMELLRKERSRDAMLWLKSAADEGLVGAFPIISSIFSNDKDLDPNGEKTIDYALKAIDSGINGWPQFILGLLYLKGEVVTKDEARGIDLLNESLDADYLAAGVEIGKCYLNGFGMEKNSEKAYGHFKSSFDKGEDSAATYLAYCLAEGVGVEKDLPASLTVLSAAASEKNNFRELVEKAAVLGSAELIHFNAIALREQAEKADGIESQELYEASAAWLQFGSDKDFALCNTFLGEAYIYGCGVETDLEKGLDLIRRGADAGFPMAHELLGKFYFMGLAGCEKDVLKAIEYFKKASTHKAAVEAKYWLAQCYLGGEGVEKNEGEYLRLITESATLDAGAMLELAMIYKEGRLVEQDLDRFLELLKQSSDKGQRTAKFTLAEHFLENNENREVAIKLLQEATDLGDHRAQYKLGKFYLEGAGSAVKKELAIELLERSANENNLDAINFLGYCYFYGMGAEKDEHKSTYWFEKGVNLGSIYCSYHLAGDYHWERGGRTRDDVKAFELCKHAADAGMPEALELIGDFHRLGIGTAVNPELALESYKKSQDLGNVKVDVKISDIEESKRKNIEIDSDEIRSANAEENQRPEQSNKSKFNAFFVSTKKIVTSKKVLVLFVVLLVLALSVFLIKKNLEFWLLGVLIFLLGIFSKNDPRAGDANAHNSFDEDEFEDDSSFARMHSRGSGGHMQGSETYMDLHGGGILTKHGNVMTSSSGEVYTQSGNVMTNTKGDVYNKIDERTWIDRDGDLIQKQGGEYANLNTGVRSSFGDPFEKH